MSDALKPVIFRIVLDTEDARKQLDALGKGGGKGTSSGKGLPQAPKPQPGTAGRAVGERGGTQAPSPGSPLSFLTGPEGASGPGYTGLKSPLMAAGSGFNSYLGGINNAVVDPIGAAEGAAETGIGGALGAAAGIAAIIATSAIFLEQVVPLILNALAEELPDMPFFKEWAREFDNDVSDKITDIRTWITSVIPALSETASIDKAILQSGGRLPNQMDLLSDLFGIEHEGQRFKADIEKEANKQAFKALSESLAAGLLGGS